MPRNNYDIEEPLLPDTGVHLIHANADDSIIDERFTGRRSSQSIVYEGGEPLRGDVKLNQATATLAATIIGKHCQSLRLFLSIYAYIPTIFLRNAK